MLPKQIQLQFILETMQQEELTPVDIKQFTEPWKSIYKIMSEVNPGEAIHALFQQTSRIWNEEWGDRKSIIDKISTIEPLSYPSLLDLSKDLAPICWLWEHWIPRGMLSLFGAVPGAGKSYIALDLARRVISPRDKFPDGSDIPSPAANVIYVDAEVIPQMLNERSSAWAMDTSKLFLMLPEQYSYIDLTTERDQDQLITMIHVLHPELVIIDSLSSITTRGENSVEDVRAVLSFLAQLAEQYQCGMLLIHHLRKKSNTPFLTTVTQDDFRGSGHIIAMSRSVIGLSVIQDSPQPNKNGPRQLEIVKTNLGPYPKPLGVEIKSLKQNPKYAEIAYGKPPMPYREPNQVELCADWMIKLINEYDQPLKPQEIIELAADEDFSRASVYRAKDLLGDQLIATGIPRDPTTKWGTPGVIEKWEKEIEAQQHEFQPDQPPNKLDLCKAWLVDLLNSKGPIDVKEIQSLAKPAGYNRSILYRAKESLNGQIYSPNRGIWAVEELVGETDS